MLEVKKQTVWKYGNSELVGYPLDEIDTFGDNTPHSVLETILVEHAMEFITDPVIKAILNDKWEKYAKLYFWLWCGLHLLYVIVLFSLYAAFIEYHEENKSTEISLRIIILILTVAKVCFTEWQRMTELYDLQKEHGWNNAFAIYFQFKLEPISVSLFFNFVLLCANLLSICLWIALFADIHKIVIISMTLSFMAESIYLLWFCQISQSLGRFVFTTITILTGDFVRFAILFIVILIAFAGAVEFLYGQSIGFVRACITLFYISMGEGDYWVEDEKEDEYEEWQLVFNEVIYFLFLVTSAVLLFNLLIAVFTETIDKLGEEQESLFIFQRATVILSIERKVDGGMFKKLFRHKRTGVKYDLYHFNVDEKNINHPDHEKN